MSTIADELIKAKKENYFLQAVLNLSLGNPGNYQDVADAIVYLHNNNLINVLNEFKGLTKSIEKSDFYFTLGVFELALPYLNTTVKQMTTCVKHLIKEGERFAVGILSPALIRFFVSDSSRSSEIMKLIQSAPAKCYDFIAPCLIAGAVNNFQYFHKKAMELKNHEDVEIRKRTILALGLINYPENRIALNATFTSLKESLNIENDDNILGHLVETIFNVFLIDSSLENQAIDCINFALSKSGDCTLHAVSELFMKHGGRISENFLSMFRFHFSRVLPNNIGTINIIDFGIARLIKSGNLDEAIKYIGNLLLATEIPIKSFGTAVSSLSKNMVALNRLTTLWLLRGEYKLCIALKYILDSHGLKNIILEVDPTIIAACNSDQFIFMAKKAIGYLFFRPVTASSILVSLLDYVDKKIAKNIESLLVYPLLMNYSGSVQQYLTEIVKVKTGIAKYSIQDALDKLNSYLDNLKITSEIHELHPELSQREAYNRKYNRAVVDSYKEAQKNSIFSSIATKCVMLYGKKSINFIYDLNGQSNRVEIPMQTYSTTVEAPRLECIDPCGMQYLLQTYKTEKIII